MNQHPPPHQSLIIKMKHETLKLKHLQINNKLFSEKKKYIKTKFYLNHK